MNPWNYFLRVISALTHYSAIVSDIPLASIYVLYILTFYLTFFLAYTLTDILSGIYSDILSGKYAGIYSGIHSGILCGIYYDTLSGMISGIYSDSLSDMATEIRRSPLKSHWDLDLRPGSAHWNLGLAVELRQCPLRSGVRSWGGRRKEEGGGRRKEEEVTLIKSRDPYLAGGEKHDFLMLPLSPPFQKNANLIVSWTQLLLFAFSTLPYRKSQIHCLEIMFLGFPHGFSISFLCIWVCLKIMGTTPNSVV